MANHRPKILIIDDAPINLTTLGTALADDFELQIALSGAMGLALATQAPPDLILLDVLMPHINGFEVCCQFKADPLLQNIPVVFITALADSDDECEGLALGAADYITKPINVRTAKLRISNLLERERLRKEIKVCRNQLAQLLS